MGGVHVMTSRGSGNAAEVAGIEPATRRRFAITIPANLLAAPDGLAINDDEIYLTTSRDGTLEAPLPAALSEATKPAVQEGCSCQPPVDVVQARTSPPIAEANR